MMYNILTRDWFFAIWANRPDKFNYYKQYGYMPTDDELMFMWSGLPATKAFVLSCLFGQHPMSIKEIAKICPRKIKSPDGKLEGVSTKRVYELRDSAYRVLISMYYHHVLKERGLR